MEDWKQLRVIDLCSTEQAADLLGVTERTIANMKRDGRITPVGRFGRAADVYLKSDVEGLLKPKED